MLLNSSEKYNIQFFIERKRLKRIIIKIKLNLFFKDPHRCILHSQNLVDTRTTFALTSTKSDFAFI